MYLCSYLHVNLHLRLGQHRNPHIHLCQSCCGPLWRDTVPNSWLCDCYEGIPFYAHLAKLVQYCKTWELVEQCFDNITFECTNYQALSRLIARLTRGSIAERENAFPWTQSEKYKVLAKCRRSQRAWCAKKTRLTVHEEGRPREVADESDKAMPALAPSIIEALSAPFLRNHSQLRDRAPDDIQWTRSLPRARMACQIAFTDVLVATFSLTRVRSSWVVVVFRLLLEPSVRTVFIPESTTADDQGRIVRSLYL